MNKKIIRNAIMCRHCGDVIESKSVHDFITCTCGTCSADGGYEYLRRCCATAPEKDYFELSVVEQTEGRGE